MFIHIHIMWIFILYLDRRWKRSYNSFSRKRRDTITITSETPNNTNKTVLINDNDDDDDDDNNDDDDDDDNIDNDINTIDKIDFEHHDELPYVSLRIYYLHSYKR